MLYINIMDLPEADRKKLEEILLKDIEALHPDEIAFLNARRDYLNYPQKVAYQSVLRLAEGEIVEPEAPADPNAADPAGTTQYTDPENPAGAATPDAAESADPAQPETQSEASPEAPADEATAAAKLAAEQAGTTEENPYGVDAKQQEELAQ